MEATISRWHCVFFFLKNILLTYSLHCVSPYSQVTCSSTLSWDIHRLVCVLHPLACCKDRESEAEWPDCYDQEVHQGVLVGEEILQSRDTASGPRTRGHRAACSRVIW